ncbi:hypothetical protein BD414DRAFT_508297 [Trametes punicea]|nr:hypothetical protein BD414DRAFT_508297 [Trametes punicea]
MALALPAPSSVAQVMPPTRSSSMKSTPSSSPANSTFASRIVLSAEPPSSGVRYADGTFIVHSPASLSPEESDDVPLSPIVFRPNEDYERNRLSFIPSPPSAASSPSSAHDDPPSPMVFSHPNSSSPSLALPPPLAPMFPPSSQQFSFEARLKRPLPPLPKVVTHPDGGATETASRQCSPARTPGRGSRAASPSNSDSDGASPFDFSPSPSGSSSHSPATSTYTTASFDVPDSAKPVVVEILPRNESLAHLRPKHLALTIPARSQSAPLPQIDMPNTSASFAHVVAVSPHISVTPASPLPQMQFPLQTPGRKKKRTASATSIVLPSDGEDDGGEPLSRLDSRALPSPAGARSPSPAPSLTPSASSTSTKSNTKSSPKSTLKRIASKTKLFGRRTLSSSDSWSETGTGAKGDDLDDEGTVVGHGSLSLDGQTLRPGTRARSESPFGLHHERRTPSIDHDGHHHPKSLPSDAPAPACHKLARATPRVEIAEVTLTPHGDVWEARELEEVIPKLRQLRAPARIRI